MVKESASRWMRKVRINSSNDVYTVLKPYFKDLDREHFVVCCLDSKNLINSLNVVSVGTLNHSIAHPREVFKPAILSNAASVIIAHNHPSGDSEPSAEDRAITKRLEDAAEILGIRFLDSLVFGENDYQRVFGENDYHSAKIKRRKR